MEAEPKCAAEAESSIAAEAKARIATVAADAKNCQDQRIPSIEHGEYSVYQFEEDISAI